MGNTDSNESNASRSSEEDSARRQRENTTTVVGAATAVAAAGWAVTKLLSSLASEDEKTNDKGRLMVAAETFSGYQIPTNKFEGYFQDEKTNARGKMMKATGGKLKMNIGASTSDDRSQAGFGGVIRDEGGRWIMGFYGRISMRDCKPEQAVIWGIYNGLKIIQGEKFRQVEIKLVSEPAVIHLSDKTRRKSRIDDIVEECKGMLLSTGCKLSYTDRKGIADALAELGRDQVTDLVRLISLPRIHAPSLLNTRNAILTMMDATGGKLKMNTDASLSGDPSRAGFGGVIRDGSGRWIMGFYGRILRDCSNPEQAEIWGIYNGLKIIQEEKFREVEIKSDSVQAINHLTSKTRKMSAINDIIKECKGMLEITGCSLNHTRRKGNKVADALAELGRDREETDLVRLVTLPKEIKSLLDVDARSASLARRQRENTLTAVGAVTAVAAVAVAGWAVTKLLSSSTSEEDEKTNDKGKSMVAVGTSSGYRIPRNRFEDSPCDYFPDEKTNERQKMMVAESYQIPSNEFEDSHSDSEDEETDEECPYPYQIKEGLTRRDQQISGKPIRWRFPGYGKLKLNTDGSVKRLIKNKDFSVRYDINPPRAGFGGVIRDETGSLIVGFYGRLKDGCEVLEAELWGIYKGLEIIQVIRGLDIREVEIESDSTSAVHLIKDETAYKKSPLKELVEKCKAMKQEMGCTLKHTLREGNRVADKLAKEGRDQYDNFFTFNTPPNKSIRRSLAKDVASASSY